MFRALEAERLALLEHLGNGGTLNPSSAEETLANTALTVGLVRGINRLLEIDFVEEEPEEDQPE